MTKNQIFAAMNSTPLMESIRRGTIEQLLNYRQYLATQIAARKNAMFQSYKFAFLFTEICCFLVLLRTGAATPEFIAVHIGGHLVCAVYWYCTKGARFRRAAMMEKVMMTLIDAAIAEKRADNNQTQFAASA